MHWSAALQTHKRKLKKHISLFFFLCHSDYRLDHCEGFAFGCPSDYMCVHKIEIIFILVFIYNFTPPFSI